MTKLSDELPIIKLIKQRMSKDDNFTKDQVRDFERRVGRTYSLRFIVQMLQRCDEKIKENDEERDELLEEFNHLEKCNHANAVNLKDEKAKSQKLKEENSMLRSQNERLKKRIEELEKTKGYPSEKI